jgi:hypothetical protein
MAFRVIITKDKVNSVIGSITKLVGKQVLVGIPEANAARQSDEESKGPVTNAMIGYLMETGSPARNVPARPWLVPGTRESQNEWMPHLRGAAAAALDAKPQRSDAELVAAGTRAASGVKRKINSNIPPPLKPSTIRARKYARQTQSRRPEEKQYLEQVRSGIDPGTAQAAASIVSLVNTGALRDSVTSIVRTKK